MLNQYQIKKGDTLTSIGKRYGVTVDLLVKANPQIKDPDKIYEGDWITVPVLIGAWQRFWQRLLDLFR